EDAITLRPRLSLEPEAKRPRVINEAVVLNCISCGKPLGTEKMISGMLAKLAQHSMFAAPGALDRLKMCADCRVLDLMKNGRGVDIRDFCGAAGTRTPTRTRRPGAGGLLRASCPVVRFSSGCAAPRFHRGGP